MLVVERALFSSFFRPQMVLVEEIFFLFFPLLNPPRRGTDSNANHRDPGNSKSNNAIIIVTRYTSHISLAQFASFLDYKSLMISVNEFSFQTPLNRIYNKNTFEKKNCSITRNPPELPFKFEFVH